MYGRISNFSLLKEKFISDITAVDPKEVLNHWMNEGCSYTTVKKVDHVLKEYFRYLTQQEISTKNPLNSVPMIKITKLMSSV